MMQQSRVISTLLSEILNFILSSAYLHIFLVTHAKTYFHPLFSWILEKNTCRCYAIPIGILRFNALNAANLPFHGQWYECSECKGRNLLLFVVTSQQRHGDRKSFATLFVFIDCDEENNNESVGRGTQACNVDEKDWNQCHVDTQRCESVCLCKCEQNILLVIKCGQREHTILCQANNINQFHIFLRRHLCIVYIYTYIYTCTAYYLPTSYAHGIHTCSCWCSCSRKLIRIHGSIYISFLLFSILILVFHSWRCLRNISSHFSIILFDFLYFPTFVCVLFWLSFVRSRQFDQISTSSIAKIRTCKQSISMNCLRRMNLFCGASYRWIQCIRLSSNIACLHAYVYVWSCCHSLTMNNICNTCGDVDDCFYKTNFLGGWNFREKVRWACAQSGVNTVRRMPNGEKWILRSDGTL